MKLFINKNMRLFLIVAVCTSYMLSLSPLYAPIWRALQRD
ncbi:hypothetical protein HMPREF0201_02540 [Cedecea davisae DSM 4568]|uniref:Uncharacterized protein n=1 Tax=Cedecea davisae DSM 4568 TaxID=566551 RepID=S3IT99_9ENTR|nr:hypothetical protein HMPREF0201_02540 [Cedecea davisae DSM 4568]